ncbi:kinase-like protein, partial [Suillus subalutaceus]|uniref:kinase-like protein n=1 Tax=Suillus subalutaceus TaxID=48586 RepID=UPI001B87F612
FVAIKILTGAATVVARPQHAWELQTLYRILSPPNAHCLRILSHFTLPGKGSSGDHICLVTQILGGSLIGLFRAYNGPTLPLPLTKRILLHTLRGVAHAHSRGVVHTDLSFEAIFLDNCMSNSDIDDLLESDPSRRYPPEESYDGRMQAAVSQPLPVPTLQEAMQRTFILANSAVVTLPIGASIDEIHSWDNLRPPENFIRGPWDKPVDIWSFGCLIFELVTDLPLFNFEPWPPLNLDEPNYILWQMMSYTGERFLPEQLNDSQRAIVFFDGETCRFRRSDPPLCQDYIERCIRRCKNVVEEEDIISTAAMIRWCLRLDPANRPSAAELLTDPWFAGVDPV